LKIAYLHFHLKPGGVTTVIRHQAQHRPHGTASVVLCGEAPSSPFPVPVVTVPGIGYDGAPGTEKPARSIAVLVDRAIKCAFGEAGRCDVIHVHNPILAKNRQFLDIIRHLQSMGYPLLLQVHDFAEDGRPGAYFHREDYPSDCHYSVINRRDHRYLLDCGLDPDGLHYLPNSVAAPELTAPTRSSSDYLLYPVRAIRRKNIGEALLLSIFLHPPRQLYVTLPPNSPADFPAYRRWQRLTAEKALPVQFEMGLQHDFPKLVQHAQHVVTTSIAEGFGFAFLEPWMAGKSVEGRFLPEICPDFTDVGINLDHLYPRLEVPMAWIGRSRTIKRFQAYCAHNRRLFGAADAEAFSQRLIAPLLDADTLDFGMLDEPLQAEVIESVISDPAKKRRLKELNPTLRRMEDGSRPDRPIAHNQRRILETFSHQAVSKRLEQIYRQVLQRPVTHRIDKTRLMDKFFKSSNFSLLKWKTPCNG
jgi:hypothetical protein